MIQTHMLKLDPPYQIIHAGGEVGLHIATLVVTKESETEDGKYAIETHSHPVVSRVSKVHNTIGEACKMYSEGEYSEGIVWNKVELPNVDTFCMEGTRAISLDLLNWVYAGALGGNTKRHILRLGNIVRGLKRLGVGIELPFGSKKEMKELNRVELDIDDSCPDQFPPRIDGGNDYCHFWLEYDGDVDHAVEELSFQATEYTENVFPAGWKVAFKFYAEDERLKPIAEKLNQRDFHYERVNCCPEEEE